jgi:hypothetical protein
MIAESVIKAPKYRAVKERLRLLEERADRNAA